MRTLVFALALSLSAQSALATGLSETLVDPEVIAEETRNPSSGGFIIPLLLLAIITVVTTRNPGTDPTCPIKTGCD